MVLWLSEVLARSLSLGSHGFPVVSQYVAIYSELDKAQQNQGDG